MYTDQPTIQTLIAPQFLNEALDDDGDGVADANLLGNIIAAVSLDINGRLASIYTVPFPDPAPTKVQAAALILACEAIYARRLAPDERNPFKARADLWREELDMIGHGKLEIDSTAIRKTAPGAAVTECPSVIGSLN